jgi:hypothetical protein
MEGGAKGKGKAEFLTDFFSTSMPHDAYIGFQAGTGGENKTGAPGRGDVRIRTRPLFDVLASLLGFGFGCMGEV